MFSTQYNLKNVKFNIFKNSKGKLYTRQWIWNIVNN